MYKLALKEKPLQLVATSDIGWFAAQAFINPSEYAGQSISLAGDDLTYADVSKAFKNKVGTDLPTTFSFLGSAMMWGIADLGTMFRWFHTDGYGSDIQALKKTHPGLLSFEEWLEKESKFDTLK